MIYYILKTRSISHKSNRRLILSLFSHGENVMHIVSEKDIVNNTGDETRERKISLALMSPVLTRMQDFERERERAQSLEFYISLHN